VQHDHVVAGRVPLAPQLRLGRHRETQWGRAADNAIIAIKYLLGL
jgi:hypothetical protein